MILSFLLPFMSAIALRLPRFSRATFPSYDNRLMAYAVLTCMVFVLGSGCASGCDDDSTQGEDMAALDMSTYVDMPDVSVEDASIDRPDTSQDMRRDMGDIVVVDDMPTVQPDPDMSTSPIDLGAFDFGAPEEDQGLLPLTFAQVTPSRGPVDGGTPFVIDGTGFTANTVVFFGSQQASVELVSGVLVGETPVAQGPGPVTIRLIDPDQGDVIQEDAFTYTPTFTLSAVSPSRVPVAGLIEVEVQGRGFDAETRVSFGSHTALSHELVDDTLLRVIAPPHAEGSVDVRVSNLDATRVLGDAVTYYTPTQIHDVKPGSGPLQGGQVVEVSGDGFEPGMEFRFGSQLAIVEYVKVQQGDDVAAVRTPAVGSGGLVHVSALTPSGQAALKTNAYFYAEDSSVLDIVQIDPARGPASGGQSVRLIGTGFTHMPPVTVSFGGNNATVLKQQEGYLLVSTPSSATLGSADVLIDGTLVGSYEYLMDLQVNAVAPSEVSVSGGEVVTVSGTGFDANTSVFVGGVEATSVTVLSDSELEVVTPPYPAGAVDIKVVRDGLEDTLEDCLTYVENIEIYGFDPVRGSIAGGTYVTFRGRALDQIKDVSFGNQIVQELIYLDSQTLALKTPAALLPGSVPVSFTTLAGNVIHASQEYLYFNPGARFGGAWGSSIQGAVNVTVYSQGGGSIENAFVMLSSRADTQYQGFTDSNGMITLSGPEVFGEQSVTAIAAGYSSATVQRVDAENITIFLSPPPNPGNPPGGPLPATFRGQLTGLNKLAEPGPSQFAMAMVLTTQLTPGTPNPSPGSQNTLLADGEYIINTRLGDLALIALGGLYDNNTQTFTPLRMGVVRYLFASEGMVYNDVDIDLDIVLDQTLSIKMNNTPSYPTGPSGKQVKTWMDFGFEGVFGGLPVARGDDSASLLQINSLPELVDQLSDVDLFIEASTTTGGNAPYSVGLLRGVTQLNQILNVDMLDVPIMTSPSEGARPQDNLITFSYNSPDKPDLYYVRVQTLMQETRWEGFLPGDATSLSLPDFPDFSSLPPELRPFPYSNELLMIAIIAIKQPGLDFNQFDYTSLNQELWTAYSVSVHTITL